ncbi:cation:proton antiporter [Profundibacterium mesophilum]|uniref:Sodiumhydrogen exchanger family protein n=1 Tax=Profundibacterium mesophilum KAUST100406-0324 TaxID=1037889 RepID=A0A921NVS5_9RHOB|nr:sodium:proton antiporter [Profundibacterium mesophilum]KAF0677614.1 Sodiumhydrogen exchanger family protein [Profundibacterium mesophilum KAUST100406-0324]
MAAESIGSLDPVMAIALVGTLGVGSQWLAWRLRMPAIVLMLVAGLLVGPVFGFFDPMRDIGPMTNAIIAVAVAVILFEGGLTLNFHTLRDAAEGVKRLVFIGAPLGWLLSTLALRWGAGLSWESSAVFGGIMIVTGPTVIAPLLRTARLARRPALLLQWEAIVNDPIGALAAVLAFEVVLVLRTAEKVGGAVIELGVGIGVATALGLAAGYGLTQAFRRAWVPEYMKVPVLFTILLAVFAVSDSVLHESGLLAVTIMGIYLANANLPSYEEMRRFKEHATVLLVSGVFILLAASLDFSALGQLTWRAGIFVAAVVIVARPLTVMVALASTRIPMRERALIALTGPRGVVLVAVAGLFGERLVELGVEDGALIGPLAFVLVAVTVVIHGFTLKPFSRALGLQAAETPGVLFVGGSRWTTGLAETLKSELDLPVLISDPNRSHLRRAREAGVTTFYGDILSEGAERNIDMASFSTLLVATDNDAYNTLVATDLAPDFGRENIYQIGREKSETARHALPASLGGQSIAHKATYNELNRMMWQGWTFRVTRLSEEYGMAEWREKRPNALLLAYIDPEGEIHFLGSNEGDLHPEPGTKLVSMLPPEENDKPLRTG